MTSVTASEFIHPADAAALESLKSIPLLGSCVQTFMKIGIERYFHGLFMAKKIRLSEEQLPGIYKHLPPICDLLGIERPELYLEMNPFPNAYTLGSEKTFICVTSGLVEIMNEEELRAVIAHECGHIACQHMLYHTMALLLVSAGANLFEPFAAVVEPVKVALLYWNRRSELSADRAGAVVVGGPKPIVSTMIRLAGGPRSITDGINLEAYIAQAADYDKLGESIWDKVLQTFAISDQDHPFLSVRAREISQWAATEHFQRVVRAIAESKWPKCAQCGRATDPTWKFCNFCGASVLPIR